MKLVEVNGTKTMKQGDTVSELKFRVLEEDGTQADLAGRTAKIIIVDIAGKKITKTPAVTDGVLSFSFDESDQVWLGPMRLEVHLTDMNDADLQIAPSDGYYRFTVIGGLG